MTITLLDLDIRNGFIAIGTIGIGNRMRSLFYFEWGYHQRIEVGFIVVYKKLTI